MKTKKKSKIRKLLTLLAIIVFITGLVLVLFPPISNTVGKIEAEKIAEDFDRRVEIINTNRRIKKAEKQNAEKHYVYDESDTGIDYYKVDIGKLYADSKKYNGKIRNKQESLLISDSAFTKPALHLSQYGIYDGIYGYVDIPKIDLKIPMYLGTQNDHMSCGAAHLTLTSLPIGDENSNSVLAGHTGYIGRIFFDNIRSLNQGDTVRVKNYWATLNFKVTETKVVAPSESQDIYIEDGRKKLVLVTCISNGYGGFNRFLVICEQ